MKLKERRQFPRIDIDYVTVEVYNSTVDMNASEVEEICPVINLSETGMKFRAEQTFTTGQILRLTFILPDSMVVIRTNATVVYLYRTNDRNLSDFGVQFKNIDIAERKLISHFIDKKISKIQ